MEAAIDRAEARELLLPNSQPPTEHFTKRYLEETTENEE